MRYIASWALWAAGHLISVVFLRFDCTAAALYPAYNRLMQLSDEVQGPGNGPWGNVK